MRGNRVALHRRSQYESTESVSIEGRKHRPDYAIALVAGILLALGMIVMYSISPAVAALSGEASSYYFTRHFLSFVLGLVAAIVVYHIKISVLKKAVYPLAVLSILASGLILVLDGVAYRWIKIAGFSFQPAEMVKFGLILWLGFFLARQRANGSIADWRKTLKPVLIVVGIIAFVTVILQRDLGSMVVLAAITGAMLFIASVPMRPLMLLMAAAIALGTIAIASTPYRRARFETFMNPERDCQNEGYHACQALIAVGSGGLMGLGVGNSVQAYGYLPETPTDSIFAIYAEKFGFMGSVIMVALLGVLALRILTVASRTLTWEARLITIGTVTWITVQSMINIGAMLGLMPLKGITLPFVSYGGSSLIFIMMMLGVVMRISCYTSVRKNDIESKSQTHIENTVQRGRDRRSYHTPLSGRS